jgi:hypothetical protein
MIQYCKENKRKFCFINTYENNLFYYYIPFIYRKLVLHKIILAFQKYQPVAFIQNNDTNIFQDMCVRISKMSNTPSIVIQWANTAPEKFYEYMRRKKILKIKYRNKLTRLLREHLYKLYDPIDKLLGIHSNMKNKSLGQGNSDYIFVINEYSRDLLIIQGINPKKIEITGLLHFDDVIKVIDKSREDIMNNWQIDYRKKVLVYFTQPFYRKDIALISKKKQLNFINNLVQNISKICRKHQINHHLIIKVHPAENIEDYLFLNSESDLSIFFNKNNEELIHISDVILGHFSTVLQSAMVLSKPIVALDFIDELSNVLKYRIRNLGLQYICQSWDELDLFFSKPLSMAQTGSKMFFQKNRIIDDGKCYQRTLDCIKKIIEKKNLQKNETKNI